MTANSPLTTANWRDLGALAPLALERTGLRELRGADAAALAPLLQDAQVQRFMPGAPKTAKAFRRFAAWADRQRRLGGHLCLAVTIEDQAIGLIQAWPLEPSGRTIEWGFAMGRPYWGRGLFHEAASAFVSMAVTRLGVMRLEARTAVANTKGMAALVRLGARPEGLLRQCFPLDGTRVDCTLWSILASEWAPRHVADAAAPLPRPSSLFVVK